MPSATSLLLICLFPSFSAAQEGVRPTADYAQDWESTESITAALYSIVSGPAGKQRDWKRYRALFYPKAQLYNIDSSSDSLVVYEWTVEDYVEQLGSYFDERGVWEQEVAHRTEQFGHLAHRWSTCEYRWDQPTGPPSGRCIASLTFYNDGQRWWITRMSWEGESASHSIPRRYLPVSDQGR